MTLGDVDLSAQTGTNQKSPVADRASLCLEATDAN
jgi:hypothetical protein